VPSRLVQDSGALAPVISLRARDGIGLPPCKCFKAQAILAHTRAEDRKLRKELTLEVLALKVPFGSLLSVSESSPVAGAIKGLNPYNTFDAGRARELQKSAQPATQLLSVHCLYQAMGKSARGNRFFRTKVYRDGAGSIVCVSRVDLAPRAIQP
jgi:hypothetical protein